MSRRPFDPSALGPAEGRPELGEGAANAASSHSTSRDDKLKIAIVVQRYGAEISGGAELHARYIAERLARHVQVEVLTTCATDYITWRNALNAGPEVVNGISVRRFPVARERDPEEFGSRSHQVFTTTHSLADELAWLDAEGPTSPALIEHIRTNEAQFDFFIYFSFRYYHAYHGIRAAPSKAILVPTAERDGALGLSMVGPAFCSVRAFMFNSLEERALIQAVAGKADIPGVVVGVGSDIPPQSNPIRFRQKFSMRDRFAIYIGRIDENKGCAELFEYFQRYARMLVEGLHLVLIGHPIIPIPKHPRIHHLGFVSDQDKFDALAAAELLVMPSYFESLSMVALEAWALGKPVLANGQCDVLKGQCIRSNGGLYYDNFPEFVETLRAIDFNPNLAAALGRNGRDYFQRHYAWPVIERKYLDMLDRLKREPMTTTVEPWPGWFARRRRTVAPANQILARLPKGAVLADAESGGPRPGVIAGKRVEAAIAMPAANAPARRSERTERPRQGDRRSYPRGRQQRNRRPGGRPPRRPGNR